MISIIYFINIHLESELNSEEKMKLYPKSADLQPNSENNKVHRSKAKHGIKKARGSTSKEKIDKTSADNINDGFENIALMYLSEIYNSYTEMIIIDDKISIILDVNVDDKFDINNCSKQMYIISKIKDKFLYSNVKIDEHDGTRYKNVSLEQMHNQENTFILKGNEMDVKECIAYIINGLTQWYKNREKIKYQKDIKDEIDVIY